jgi:hypothetical protein
MRTKRLMLATFVAIAEMASPLASRAARSSAGEELTLEDITIEGNVVVPQVLFITARDQKRFMDDLHRRYLPSALELGQRTVLPAVVSVDLTPSNVNATEADSRPGNQGRSSTE